MKRFNGVVVEGEKWLIILFGSEMTMVGMN